MLLTQKCKFVKIKYIEVKLNQKYIRRERNIMMKKNGFTLAEVLITLAIIGVVATLTLPALMTNTAEQQAKTALKKGINTLTEAAQMNQAISGFDYASLTTTDTDNEEAQSLYGLLATRTSVDFQKSGTGKIPSHQGDSTDKMATTNFALFFRDGSALVFPSDISSSSTETYSDQQDDGLVYGLPVIYDTNGAKGPNILSNCQAEALGVASDKTAKEGDVSNPSEACKPANRVIKDQFGVRLRGGYAVPNGVAARWAFEN